MLGIEGRFSENIREEQLVETPWTVTAGWIEKPLISGKISLKNLQGIPGEISIKYM